MTQTVSLPWLIETQFEPSFKNKSPVDTCLEDARFLKYMFSTKLALQISKLFSKVLISLLFYLLAESFPLQSSLFCKNKINSKGENMTYINKVNS